MSRFDDPVGAGHGVFSAPLTPEQLSEAIRAYECLADQPATLLARIDLLRRLRDLDWRSPRWTQALGACEQEHKSALREELRAMADRLTEITDHDAALAEVLASSLASSEWLEPLGGDEIQEVHRNLLEVRRARTLEKIDAILSRLDAARDRGEWESARDLVAELSPMWREAAIRPEDDRWRVFDHGRRWVDEEYAVRVAARAHAVAIESFHQACSACLSWSVSRLVRQRSLIDASARQLLLAGPQPATRELADISALARTARRRIDRRMAMIVGIATCCGMLLMLTVSVITATVNQSRSRSRIVAETREAVLGPVKAGRLQGARDAWNKAADEHAWLASHSLATEVGDAVMDLERANHNDRTTVGQMTEQIDRRLRGGCDAALKKLREACAAVPPSRADIDTARNLSNREVAEVIAAIETTTSRLAAVEARQDGVGVGDVRSPLDRALLEARRLDGEIKTILDQGAADASQRLRDRLGAIERLLEAGTLGVDDELRQARIQRADIGAFGRSVPRDLDEELAQLEMRTKAVAARTSLREKLDAAAQAGSGQLLLAVKNLAAAREEGVHEQLARVVATAPAIEAAEAWALVARAWRTDLKVNAAEAADWAKLLGLAIEAANQPSFDAEDTWRIQRLNAFLLDRAGKKTMRCLEPLTAYLDARIMQPCVICVTNGDRRLYTEPDADGSRFVDEETMARRGELGATPAIAAAHVPLARRLREILVEIVRERIDPDEGVAALLRACGDVQLVGATDQLLLCRLQRSILEAAKQGVLFEPAAASLEGAELRIRAQVGRRPAWVDPELWSSVNAWRKATEAAAEVILKSQEIEGVLEAYRVERERLGERPAACKPLDFVGWIDTTPPGPTVRLRQTPAAKSNGDLYVIQQDDGVGWTLAKVGATEAAAVRLNPNARLDFGQPVYVVPR